jgi:hypothetical protein
LSSSGDKAVEAVGLVDSGATVNVLPYEIGIELGGVWDDNRAIIQLAGNLSNMPAIPFFANVEIGGFAPVQLVFAWVRRARQLLKNFLENLLMCI